MRWSWCIKEMFRWNGADGKQIGEDSEDCERKGDQVSRDFTTRSIILEISVRLEIGR